MVIPWVGFPLKDLIASVKPTSKARYVAFETLMRPSEMTGQAWNVMMGFCGQLSLGHADIEGDILQPRVQPLQMGLKEQQPAVVQPQPLPHPVAQHEAGVEHRHPRLILGHELAAHIDLEIGVPRVRREILTTCHATS